MLKNNELRSIRTLAYGDGPQPEVMGYYHAALALGFSEAEAEEAEDVLSAQDAVRVDAIRQRSLAAA